MFTTVSTQMCHTYNYIFFACDIGKLKPVRFSKNRTFLAAH
jgi:hypothetical protein